MSVQRQKDMRIAQAQQGDLTAFEELVREHERKIYNLCFSTMGSAEDAADMAQETLLKAWRALQRFDGRSSLGTWLYRIAVNTCLDELRRRKNRTTVSIQNLAEKGWEPEDDGGDFVERSIQREEVRQALRELPDDYRTVLILRDIQGFSYDEIAAILSCPVGTVRSRLNRARGNMVKKLSGGEQKKRRSV